MPIGLSLAAPLRPSTARLERVPEPTAAPGPTTGRGTARRAGRGTGAVAATGAPPAVRLAAAAAPGRASVWSTTRSGEHARAW